MEIRRILRHIILALALVAPGAVAQTALEVPRTIRVAFDNAYAPYSFQSDDGKLQGILIDQWQSWEKKTGIKVEMYALDWDEALRRTRSGEFDVIDSIVETAERRNYFDFTPAYTTIEASIYFRNDISGITDLTSLKGFPVGVKTGDQHTDQLRANGVTSLILYKNNEEIILAAKEHKINVFVVDDLAALYLLNKDGIESEFRHSAPVFQDELRRAVRKGDAATLGTVSRGFAAIEPGELKQIEEKWFGRTIDRYGRYLTYAGYAAVLAILIIAGLVGWNRALRRSVLRRTAALAESEQRFRQIAENIHEVFWMSTPGFGTALFAMLYISRAYESVWGRTRESLYRNPGSFIDAIHPEDQSRVVDVIKSEREQGFEVEYRVMRPDGSIRWIWDRGFPIRDESGHFYRVAGIAEDITERKQVEDALRRSKDHLRRVVDTIPTMAWSIRPDGTVDFLNQRWVDYTGLSLEEFAQEPTGPIHPEDIPSVLEKWRANMTVGKAYEDEMRLRRADGEYRWFLVRTAPLRDEQGNLVEWYGTSTDITDRKQTEEQLKITSEQFRALSARLSSAREEEGTRIARELHDELGAALTSLKWDLEGLSKRCSGREKQTDYSVLRERIEKMIALVDDILGNVRRISSELRPGILDDLGLIAAIEWQARQFESRSGIVCEIDPLFDDAQLNREQSTAIFRILQEALTNILRHARASRVNILIEEADGELVLEIRDNGRGTTEEEIAGSQSLGLIGMRERAHMLGGTIEITGALGGGTVITLRVPIHNGVEIEK